jgi:hypothetical protein
VVTFPVFGKQDVEGFVEGFAEFSHGAAAMVHKLF